MANRVLRVGQDAQHYGVQAKSFKTHAATKRFSKVKASSLRIAAIYEHLAELAEGAPAPFTVSKQANDVCPRQMHGGPAARRVRRTAQERPEPGRNTSGSVLRERRNLGPDVKKPPRRSYQTRDWRI